MSNNPNFPQNLDIQPSSPDFVEDFGVKPYLDGSQYDQLSQKLAISKYGIAGRVWEAAYALNIYLNPPHRLSFEPPFCHKRDLCILELGSGSGMIGINLALSLQNPHYSLILTDLPEVCPLLENNVEEAKDAMLYSRIKVVPLAWGSGVHACNLIEVTGDRPLSHILCSDLIYFPELLAPLLRTLIQLSSPPFATSELEILISYKIRSLSKETPFWSAFGLWFTFEPVLFSEKSPDGTQTSWERFGSAFEGPIFIFVARRRPESLTWSAPQNDGQLLAGFGAHGSMQPKADEQFETLLFMSMVET
ncbi:hypothetical protein D9757_002498 [Collybiopsis confluens]|uniref:Methyltransferase-domain-containing protein n=1 Tax=Collybiopsis confluens TaxID=2823264 RepID=A0A8H5MF44_9AGAR|nr:hypothetical protein D9757_002498 [Collybiopsis confluens]